MLVRLGLSTSAAAAALISGGLSWADPPAVSSSQTGLGVTGPDTPQVLQQIAAAPYAPSDGASCRELAEQLAALDDVLGPDLDAPKSDAPQNANIGHAAAGAVRTLMPYRGVVRLVTGAGKKEARMGQAVVAGAARRGYLRGLSHERGCDGAAPAAAPVVADAAPDAGQDVASRAEAPRAVADSAPAYIRGAAYVQPAWGPD